MIKINEGKRPILTLERFDYEILMPYDHRQEVGQVVQLTKRQAGPLVRNGKIKLKAKPQAKAQAKQLEKTK